MKKIILIGLILMLCRASFALTPTPTVTPTVTTTRLPDGIVVIKMTATPTSPQMNDVKQSLAQLNNWGSIYPMFFDFMGYKTGGGVIVLGAVYCPSGQLVTLRNKIQTRLDVWKVSTPMSYRFVTNNYSSDADIVNVYQHGVIIW